MTWCQCSGDLACALATAVGFSAEQIAEPSGRFGKVIGAVDAPHIRAATRMNGRWQHDIAAIASNIEAGSDRAGTVPDIAIFAFEKEVAAARRDAFHRCR